MSKDSLLLMNDLGMFIPALDQGAMIVSPLFLPMIGSGTTLESNRLTCVLGDEQKWIGTPFVYQKPGFSPGQMILTSVVLVPDMISKGVMISNKPALKIGAGQFLLTFTTIPGTAIMLSLPFAPDPTPMYTGKGKFNPIVMPVSMGAQESS